MTTCLLLPVSGCGADPGAAARDTASASSTPTSLSTTTSTAASTTTKPPGAPCNADAYRLAWGDGDLGPSDLIVADAECNGTWALVNYLQGPNRTSFLGGLRAEGGNWAMVEFAKSGVDEEFVATLREAGFPPSLLRAWGEALDGPGSAFA